MVTLLIDNYDSFTFNLAQLIGFVEGRAPIIRRNDEITLDAIAELGVRRIVISPGPGRPDREADFGICGEIIERSGLPILGVCLGHQGIGHAAGGSVVRAPEPMHGRLSPVYHDGSGLFEGLPSPISVVRYHSLMVPTPLPPDLRRNAWTEDGIVMGVEHQRKPIWGVQFHPESICTEYGEALIRNFIRMSDAAMLHYEHGPAPSGLVREAAARLSAPFRVLSRRIEATVDAPALFSRLYGRSASAFWLDSARLIEGYSRFSFMGDASGPNAELLTYDVSAPGVRRTAGDRSELSVGGLFDHLRHRLAEVRIEDPGLPFAFCGGWVGYLGYELKALCGARNLHASDDPDACLAFVDRFIAIDGEEGAVWIVHLVRGGQDAQAEAWMDEIERAVLEPAAAPIALDARPGTAVRFTARHGRDQYIGRIREAQELIRDGESYEICLTNQIVTDRRVDPLTLYNTLRSINPAPYAAFLNFPGLSIMSSSPERFLMIDRAGRIEAKPIKGTAPRSADPIEDDKLAAGLRSSEKNRAENLMIVDLLRNDLGAVCETGSVHVPKLLDIESYATVHQMVSTIAGQLAPERSPVDAVASAFPGGSMTGAPKLRAMEIIDELEEGPRGVYSGAIGYISLNGAVDLSIVIRTIVQNEQGVSLGCGGAITHLSDPVDEYDELRLKATAPMRALAQVLTGDPDNWTLEESSAGFAEQDELPTRCCRSRAPAATSSPASPCPPTTWRA
jgi:para-aminobenzoate synthetase